MSYRHRAALLVDGSRRREDTVIYRSGFSNEAETLALGL
jgi:hypothetical protein